MAREGTRSTPAAAAQGLLPPGEAALVLSDERENHALAVRADGFGVLVLRGHGDRAAARAVVAALERGRHRLKEGPEVPVRALIDIRAMTGASLGAQLTVGRWLVKRRKELSGVAVFGGSPLVVGLGRAVMRTAGLSQVSFVDSHQQALAALGS